MLKYCEGEEVYNIARIKADPEEDKIFISISGREKYSSCFPVPHSRHLQQNSPQLCQSGSYRVGSRPWASRPSTP